MDSYIDFVVHHRILFVVVSKWAYILKAGSNTRILSLSPSGKLLGYYVSKEFENSSLTRSF
jgi:hypothetical protein